jgi:cell division protein FtsB
MSEVEYHDASTDDTIRAHISSPDNSLPSYEELAAQNVVLLEQNHQMREEIQALRDEIARLKKQKPKPKISPSKMDEKRKKNRIILST